jgi:exopolysaccharide biosynthesis polyprenyl glycosylphosphotransferase
MIATETEDNVSVQKVIDSLAEHELTVKAIPDLSDILSGSVKMTSIFGTPLIEISPVVMPEWQQTLKRLFDIGVSLIALLILSPLFLVLAMLIKWQDKGPVFYKQERVGLRGKKFNIIKFRSMFMNAESMGPALSSKNDPRITPVGRILRKYRLDEFPQFINVLEGEMSLVGPRPERQFFIEQIVLKAPHYKLLHRVRPGITSWGMVKYGYAENVDEMVKRLKYDILYIENMSLALDFRIILYTIVIMLQGRGK